MPASSDRELSFPMECHKITSFSCPEGQAGVRISPLFLIGENRAEFRVLLDGKEGGLRFKVSPPCLGAQWLCS